MNGRMGEYSQVGLPLGTWDQDGGSRPVSGPVSCLHQAQGHTHRKTSWPVLSRLSEAWATVQALSMHVTFSTPHGG